MTYWMPGHSLRDNKIRRPSVKAEMKSRKIGNAKAAGGRMAKLFAAKLFVVKIEGLHAPKVSID